MLACLILLTGFSSAPYFDLLNNAKCKNWLTIVSEVVNIRP